MNIHEFTAYDYRNQHWTHGLTAAHLAIDQITQELEILRSDSARGYLQMIGSKRQLSELIEQREFELRELVDAAVLEGSDRCFLACCSDCGSYRWKHDNAGDGSKWHKVPPVPVLRSKLSHGFCPTCYDRRLHELDERDEVSRSNGMWQD
jgi:hypothetical protein